jgi:hypothetical protein
MSLDLYLRKFSSSTNTGLKNRLIVKGPLYDVVEYFGQVTMEVVSPQNSYIRLATILSAILKEGDYSYTFFNPNATNILEVNSTETGIETRRYLKWTKSDKRKINNTILSFKNGI